MSTAGGEDQAPTHCSRVQPPVLFTSSQKALLTIFDAPLLFPRSIPRSDKGSGSRRLGCRETSTMHVCTVSSPARQCALLQHLSARARTGCFCSRGRIGLRGIEHCGWPHMVGWRRACLLGGETRCWRRDCSGGCLRVGYCPFTVRTWRLHALLCCFAKGGLAWGRRICADMRAIFCTQI